MNQVRRYVAMCTLASAVTLLALVGAAGATPTGAGLTGAAPTNDNYVDRVPVGIGSSTSFDNAEATVEPLDLEAAALCAPPTTQRTLWYDVVSDTAGKALEIQASAPWSPGVLVVAGDPGSFTLAACGPDQVYFTPQPATTYHIMVFDASGNGGGPGVLNVTEAIPPTMVMSVNPTQLLDAKTGELTLSGTYLCTNARYTRASGTVFQLVGPYRITNSFRSLGFPLTCDGTTHTWNRVVSSGGIGSNGPGRFVGGKATVQLYYFACGYTCLDVVTVTQDVKLRGGK